MNIMKYLILIILSSFLIFSTPRRRRAAPKKQKPIEKLYKIKETRLPIFGSRADSIKISGGTLHYKYKGKEYNRPYSDQRIYVYDGNEALLGFLIPFVYVGANLMVENNSGYGELGFNGEFFPLLLGSGLGGLIGYFIKDWDLVSDHAFKKESYSLNPSIKFDHNLKLGLQINF